MGRGGEPGPGEQVRGTPGQQHRHREALLHIGVAIGAEPRQQFPVRGVAAQEDVLPGVDGEVVALEGVGGAAEFGAALQQGDAGAGVGQAQGGGDAGQPATDDADVALGRRREWIRAGHAGCRPDTVRGRDAVCRPDTVRGPDSVRRPEGVRGPGGR